MSAHLAHKIHWNWLAEYFNPYSDPGISFPVGDCDRIHASHKKQQIQVDMRNYITSDMICTAADCKTTGERLFRKSDKKGPPFGIGTRDGDKLAMFMQNLADTIHEFALTEITSPPKPAESRNTLDEEPSLLTFCDACNKFIEHLEFGDKQKLLEYTDSQLRDIFGCTHGGQAVGNSLSYIFHHVLTFYVYSNVIVYLDLRSEAQWPEAMRPNSYHRTHLLHACDGQTFLPYSRQYLKKAMIDLNETRTLSKRLFRFLYFYVMMKMKLDSSYKLHDDYAFSVPTYWT